MMKKLILVLALPAISTGPAVADLTAVGPAVATNSWAQTFHVDDTWFFGLLTSDFDALLFTMNTGTLDDPGMANLSAPMTITQPTKKYDLVAVGNNMWGLDFDLTFQGALSSSNPVDFSLTVADRKRNGKYKDVGSARAIWNGSNWSISHSGARLDANGNPIEYNVTPTPGAFLLGALGLSVAGLKLRKWA